MHDRVLLGTMTAIGSVFLNQLFSWSLTSGRDKLSCVGLVLLGHSSAMLASAIIILVTHCLICSWSCTTFHKSKSYLLWSTKREELFRNHRGHGTNYISLSDVMSVEGAPNTPEITNSWNHDPYSNLCFVVCWSFVLVFTTPGKALLLGSSDLINGLVSLDRWTAGSRM
jgi:hypothetical protein